ncbi:hypothetical protein D3C81_1803530 [compost metagenome]
MKITMKYGTAIWRNGRQLDVKLFIIVPLKRVIYGILLLNLHGNPRSRVSYSWNTTIKCRIAGILIRLFVQTHVANKVCQVGASATCLR